ncbi:MAG: LuxR C-terminal-related transcriptional regulator [Bacteroidales bacterium]|nr:LuxR C-terminal-related transcriptional regulator [Bacteroidales bacterium]
MDDKYLKLEWANKHYYENTKLVKEQRNHNLEEFYKKRYDSKDIPSVAGVVQQIKNDGQPYSGFYKYFIEDNKDGIWTYTNIIPYAYNKKGGLTHVLMASVFLTANNFNPDRLLDLQREVNQLKNQLAISKLSTTEIELLKILGTGKSEKEIADFLTRSIHTIKTHFKNIRKKLNVNKNTELVKFAVETGIV